MSEPYSPPARRPRRRWWPRILITLAVLAGLFVAADRIAMVVAEHEVAAAVQKHEQLARRPDVSIDGFPFLTQLIARRFGKVQVTDHDIAVGTDGRQVTLAAVDVTLHNVRVDSGYHHATAQSADASALADYGQLSTAIGVPIRYLGGGRVNAEVDKTILGVAVHTTVSAVPLVSGGSLRFVSPRVAVAGLNLPGPVVTVLSEVYGDPISLAALPYGLVARSLSVTSRGVELRMTTGAVSLTR